MRKLLVFDADNSLESLGSKEEQKKILGTTPVRCPSLHQLRDMLRSLVTAEFDKQEHEMFQEDTAGTEVVVNFNPKAKANGLWGIAIDTFSHMASTSTTRIITEVHGKADAFPIDLGVWGVLGQIGVALLEGIKNASFPVIMNCHVKEEDGPAGKIMVPDVSGQTRNKIPQVFDFVFYADKKTIDKKLTWIWDTSGSGRMAYGKVRNPVARDLIPDVIPQDFGFVLDVCQRCGITNPKILILANSGYGKTSALATVNGFYPPNFEQTNKEVTVNGIR